MTEHMAASWRKLVGTALLWVALAALFRMSQGGSASLGLLVPLLGFACFTAGLALFADGLRRSIVADLMGTKT